MSEAAIDLTLSVDSDKLDSVLEQVEEKIEALKPPFLCPRKARFAPELRAEIGVLRGFHKQPRSVDGKCA